MSPITLAEAAHLRNPGEPETELKRLQDAGVPDEVHLIQHTPNPMDATRALLARVEAQRKGQKWK